MSERPERCGTCKLWDSREFPSQEGQVCHSYCRCHSPSLVVGIAEPTFRAICGTPPDYHIEDRVFEDADTAMWPKTREWDWCGEWRPKDGEEGEPFCAVDFLDNLPYEKLRDRLDKMQGEEKALRTLLRSARAREKSNDICKRERDARCKREASEHKKRKENET